MLVLRALALLAIIAVIGSFLAFLLTGQRRYLSFSWNLLRFGVAAGVILLLLLAAERLLVVPL